nr:MAG TPA: hypothetical protein [Caudoviricetes sp.]
MQRDYSISIMCDSYAKDFVLILSIFCIFI